jgi:hypothetical protein
MVVTKYKIYKYVMNCLLSHGVQGFIMCSTCVDVLQMC